MGASLHFWIWFNAFVLFMLVLDLTVFHRHPRAVRVREAVGWTILWIALAVVFALLIYLRAGGQKTLEFATGYLIEESLSVDNLFIFLLIFRYFKVPGELQHRVLFWGIIGALIMRGAFIVAGVSLMRHFHWVIYAFGAFLVFTGARMLLEGAKEVHPEKNRVLRLFRRFFKVTPDYEGNKFLVRREGVNWATPLLVVLILVESTDVLFATDSIPAVLAITSDPFIVYTSNVFAILGLRSLYFVVAGLMGVLRFLHHGISALLIFIGGKMLISHFIEIPTLYALAGIVMIVGASIAASLLFPAGKSNVA